MEDTISLNKFISDTGYCSRREADNLITEGRVLLNDQVASLGNRYKPGDTVEVDGSLITLDNKEKRVYLALNKPIGITTTTEIQIKGNIIQFVNYPKRIFPIGRLDKDSEGLIFLTNDGDIINKILRAGNHHEKEYIVRVTKPIDPLFIQKMSRGLPIMGTKTLPCTVQMINRQTFRIILTQGLNRQIRRMCEYLGYTVAGLQRVRIMNIKLGSLPLGKWRNLSEAEVAMLMNAVAESSTTAKAGKPGRKKSKPAPAPAEEAEFILPKEKPSTGGKPNFKDKPSRGKEKKPFDREKKTGSRKDRQGKPKHKPAFGKDKFDSKKDKPAKFKKAGEGPAKKENPGKPKTDWKKNSSTPPSKSHKAGGKPANEKETKSTGKPVKGSYKYFKRNGRA